MPLAEQVPTDASAESGGWFAGINPEEINGLLGTVQDTAVSEDARRQAFGRVAEHAYDNVLYLATSLTGSAEDAQDVTQNTFERAWKHIDSFAGNAKFSTWLYRVTKNTAITFMEQCARRNTREKLGELGLSVVKDSEPALEVADTSTDSDLEILAEGALFRDRLDAALVNLSAAMRAVVMLRDVQDLSHLQIAQRLNISESASKVRLHRARKQLREAMFDT